MKIEELDFDDKEIINMLKTIFVVNLIFKIISFVGTVLFIVAKLLNWINWSWWWILIPIILPSLYTISLKSKMNN